MCWYDDRERYLYKACLYPEELRAALKLFWPTSLRIRETLFVLRGT